MRQQRHSSHRYLKGGFSVLEALMTLGLICLVLSILGSLFSSYSRLLLRQGDRQKSLLGCQVAVDTIRRDLVSCISFSIPTPETLHVEQIDPLVSSRLPRPLPDSAPADWRPHLNEERLKIDYRLARGSVLRKIIRGGGSNFEENVTDEVDGLDFDLTTNGTLRVTATALIQGNLKRWSVEIAPHLPEELYP
ncbi:MAG: hypothetical protein KF760_18200 [Candidatus Eremiobacteraeota bacterium]|nr:hypothetical protein [Candidatus Eremiobacteraeota bacterium]MCW5866728.1 hypothetical protein [Candidatus Eremiobacteraeota bacterium]